MKIGKKYLVPLLMITIPGILLSLYSLNIYQPCNSWACIGYIALLLLSFFAGIVYALGLRFIPWFKKMNLLKTVVLLGASIAVVVIVFRMWSGSL